MYKRNVLALTLVTTLVACASVQPMSPRVLGVAPSPVSFDGNVAGRPTDLVFVMDADANPAKAGIAMRTGDMMRLDLPTGFARDPQVAITADADTNLVFTKGWPQAGVQQDGHYAIGYDAATNSITVKAIGDIGTDGGNAPGIKVIHLRGNTFVNPGPGNYPVELAHLSASGETKSTWNGSIRVLASAPSARLAPTNFHLAPGANSDYQHTTTGQLAPHPLGVLLWGAGGVPMDRVGIAPRDLARHARYTGGLLVQDVNGDKVLDPAVDKVVGGIIGAAPKGAKGQAATSPVGADGKPVLSGEILRGTAFPAASGAGKPNPGLLAIAFRAGDTPGIYGPTIEVLGGNSYTFTVEASLHGEPR